MTEERSNIFAFSFTFSFYYLCREAMRPASVFLPASSTSAYHLSPSFCLLPPLCLYLCLALFLCLEHGCAVNALHTYIRFSRRDFSENRNNALTRGVVLICRACVCRLIDCTTVCVYELGRFLFLVDALKFFLCGGEPRYWGRTGPIAFKRAIG